VCVNDTDTMAANDQCCPQGHVACPERCCDPSRQEFCYQGRCCVRNCASNVCGADDGCGGKCPGACPEGQTCLEGTCTPDVCTPACPCGQFCLNGQCINYCAEGQRLCGCSECCGPGETCNPVTLTCTLG
jgi:hypothetical protein